MHMKLIAINGSPRKAWNTALLLEEALKGAASKGAETELVHLYDLNFKGCKSCFACKLKEGKSFGRCALKDDLSAVLERVGEADALVMGSPVYVGCVSTGEMRSFLERLIFPYLQYTNPYSSLFERKMPGAFIYTMNVDAARAETMGYPSQFSLNSMVYERTFGAPAETLTAYDTMQMDDYSRIVNTMFDPEKKKKSREVNFPQDCHKAFELGARLASAR